jgi:hypothetical protein
MKLALARAGQDPGDMGVEGEDRTKVAEAVIKIGTNL